MFVNQVDAQAVGESPSRIEVRAVQVGTRRAYQLDVGIAFPDRLVNHEEALLERLADLILVADAQVV